MASSIKYRHVGLLLMLFLLSYSCTERIDIELDSTYRRLVVEGVVSSDSVRHSVLLSVSSDYFSNEPAASVGNAMVELYFEDKSIQLLENTGIPGRYESPVAFRGVPGTTYNLIISKVDVDGDGIDERYQAASTMPGGSEIESVELRYLSNPAVSGHTVFLYAYNPVNQRDWFGFKLIKNGDVLTDSLTKYSVLSDDLFDTGYFPGLPVGFLNDDDPREAVQAGDTVTLEMDCIEEAYYNFVTEAQLEIAGSFPLFSGPPANASSNIDNGAQGFFTAYSIERFSLIVE